MGSALLAASRSLVRPSPSRSSSNPSNTPSLSTSHSNPKSA
tara:strand:- start:82293 stop:82415 length:123 start_codon:yes stop_codon:yes gene_type:complete